MNQQPLFDLYRFDGATVLIRSQADTHEPPAAMRGTLDVRPVSDTDRTPEVKLILDFPELFTRSAHRRVIPLDPDGVDRLLASEHDGVFEFSLPDDLDVAA